MKGVVLLGDRKAEVKEFPVPDPGPSQVLVRMTISSICGTDMHFYRKSWDELTVMRKKFNGSADTIPLSRADWSSGSCRRRCDVRQAG